MLRIAILGLLSTRQLRKLADISRKYDRASGISRRARTCSSLARLEQVPDIFAELGERADARIQTSGNCIRNITTDHFAGVAHDEVVDSFVWCEISGSGRRSTRVQLPAAQVQDRRERVRVDARQWLYMT